MNLNSFERFLGLVLRDETITAINQRAYVIATVRHETAGTFRPITEYAPRSATTHDAQVAYFESRYGNRKSNTQPGDGYRFRGRGHVQLTWRENYARFADLLGVDLLNNPELALDESISYRILSAGMSRGLFTGARLSQYVNDLDTNYIGARRVVNGQDRAVEIAAFARQFETYLAELRAKAPR